MLQRDLMGMYQLRKKNKTLLPSGYQQVEYLQSTGTQYIDTGVYPTSTTEIIIKFQATTATPVNNQRIFGTRGIVGNVNVAPWQEILYHSGNLSVFDGANTSKFYFAYDTGSHEVQFLNSGVFFDGVYKGKDTTTWTSVFTTLLFRNNQSGSNDSGLPCRIFTFTMAETVSVRNYVPCIRKTDSVAGMYDTVNHVFTENAGTGSFIAGPYVNAEAWTPAKLSPVAWYKGEDNALDSVGAYDLTSTGAFGYGVGKIGNSFLFSPSYGYLSNSTIRLATAQGFSVSAWVNIDTTIAQTHQYIASQLFYNNNQGWSLRLDVDAGGVRVGGYFGSFGVPSGYISGWASNTWHHVTLTYYSNSIKFYVDSVLVYSLTKGLNDADVPLIVRARNANTGVGVTDLNLDGYIDDLLLFDKELTPTEILKLYNESVYRGGAANLIGYPPAVPVEILPTLKTAITVGTKTP